jgi:hypothetical protein
MLNSNSKEKEYMATTWVFCLEVNHAGNDGNFKDVSDRASVPAGSSFWASGTVANDAPAAGPFHFIPDAFYDIDSAPNFHDNDKVFFASKLDVPEGGEDVQDIVVTVGRLRNAKTPALVGSPIHISGENRRPRCVLSKDTVNGPVIPQFNFIATKTTPAAVWRSIGPFTVNKETGPGAPGRSRFEVVVVARVGRTLATVDREFAHDPEVDVDNGL